MRTQEAYELMRVYLTRPGACRAEDGDGCMYETTIQGVLHRCAVGCLLTAQDLAQEVEINAEDLANDWASGRHGESVALRDFRGTVHDILLAGYMPSALTSDDEVEDERLFAFLTDAQRLHDHAGSWPEDLFNVTLLDDLAAHHGLEVVKEEEVGVPQETQVQEPVAVTASVV